MRVQSGAVEELGTLYERHHRRLFNFCLRLTGERQASEDILQEVFYRILKHRHTYRAEGDFLPWAFRFVRNATADLYRKRGRTSDREVPADAVPGEPVASAPLPIDELESEQSRQRLRHALDRLSDDKRELLLLARFEGLKHQQIAEILGCSVGAVKVRVHRAMRQLRDTFLELDAEVMA